MLFVFHLLDRTDPNTIRADIRPVHKEYLRQVADRIAFAGPLLSDDGKAMLGSLLVIDFEDRAAAEAWRAAEPFTQAGLYEKVSILAFSNQWAQKTGFPG
ncbi:MAG: YciI family protein [Burkholderiaceae bacterium]